MNKMDMENLIADYRFVKSPDVKDIITTSMGASLATLHVQHESLALFFLNNQLDIFSICF